MKRHIFATVVIGLIAVIIFTQDRASSWTYPESAQSPVVELADGARYTLTASFVTKTVDGKEYKMLAYNGTIPGPTIKVAQGSRVTIVLKNETDAPTALHSHGVRLESKFDGVVGVGQGAINPGESFTYQLVFPDAGVYWYHPHLNEVKGQALGMYGNFIVTPRDIAYWSPVDKEVPLMVSDLLVDERGIVPFGTPSTHAIMGRFGNVLLVNGDTRYTLSTKRGEVVRFYITNTANARTFNFGISGAKMKLVGGDNGKYEHEEWVNTVVLAPSERAIVEVLFDKARTYLLTHQTPEQTYTIGGVRVADESSASINKVSFNTLRTNTDVLKDIDAFRPYFAKPVDKRLAFTVDLGPASGAMAHAGHGMQMQASVGGASAEGNSEEKIEWEDTGSATNAIATVDSLDWQIKDLDSGKVGTDINWNFKKGDKVKVSIFNDPGSQHPMQHPFHIHGQRFLVLSTNDIKNDNLVWKDTVLIGKGDTMELLIDMSNPGDWMAHCHISEHLESGMTFNFKVRK